MEELKIPEDEFWTETHIGPTPNGGAYSTAYYRNKWNEPCRPEEACYIEIGEFDEKGVRIGTVYGFCGDSKKREFTDEEREYYTKITRAQSYVDSGMNLRIALNKCGLPPMEKMELKALHWRAVSSGIIKES